ncbi:conserved hypothetical protein [Beutenbergia cavernae DSM 12333]|uniref:Uncharacterized protein n=1 Tax=Beutenbergia cavernae (strain ATCC BAA-8 / DSM 12333 / CCUG 43141 / JCM 11478 / NBRC 16432 / NCIMB 13614 / HKI 0122) TaxID=471853 RepID=C5BXZ7_BEUC1|nr:DUF5701 family protein [Beutenbergia cavernae]ACQ78891.1 conserved hypothetical protein [Beutenbergia cavernae DSM 12333]
MRATIARPTTVPAPHEGVPFDGAVELERQVSRLLDLGYPELLGVDEATFRTRLEPLRSHARDLGERTAWDADAVGRDDAIPFVLVLPGIPADAAARRMELAGRAGTSMLTEEEWAGFVPRPDVALPRDDDGERSFAYLLTDIDTGSDLRDVTPEDAVRAIQARDRSPLTVAEGIAVVTQRPDMLRRNRCYSLAGSRRGDQRVPAVWISGERAPKLGWCWDRNPHTWLGTASAQERRAA